MEAITTRGGEPSGKSSKTCIYCIWVKRYPDGPNWTSRRRCLNGTVPTPGDLSGKISRFQAGEAHEISNPPARTIKNFEVNPQDARCGAHRSLTPALGDVVVTCRCLQRCHSAVVMGKRIILFGGGPSYDLSSK